MAVFASGKADHHPVALLDHVEVGDRLANLSAQAFAELAELVLGFARIAMKTNGLAGHQGQKFTKDQ
jgi:hypothetical protein